MRIVIIMFGTLSLGACNVSADRAASDQTARTQATGTATTSAPAPAGKIPIALQGRWGLNRADCKGDAAAKGLLTIDDRQMRFYESRATIGRMIASTPQSLEAEFDFTGEGQTWTLPQSLTVTGDTLRRRAGGDEPVDLTYTRCPA